MSSFYNSLNWCRKQLSCKKRRSSRGRYREISRTRETGADLLPTATRWTIAVTCPTMKTLSGIRHKIFSWATFQWRQKTPRSVWTPTPSLKASHVVSLNMHHPRAASQHRLLLTPQGLKISHPYRLLMLTWQSEKINTTHRARRSRESRRRGRMKRVRLSKETRKTMLVAKHAQCSELAFI